MSEKGFIADFRKKTLSGFMLILPLGLSVFFLHMIYGFIAGFTTPMLDSVYPDVPVIIKFFVSLVLVVFFLYILGALTGHFLGRWFWGRLERLLMQVPLLKSIYKTVKEIIQVFGARQKSGFKEVVLVSYPGSSVQMIGFVTGSISSTDKGKYFRVFIPTSPNPTTGFLVMIHEDELVRSSMTIEDGIRMVVSGGIIGPGKL